ncbi:hypothetical protein GCM10028857_16890 [Salinarchaeum chitinilyticum]
MKGDGATTLAEVGSFDGGATWVAYPDEAMARASHVLVEHGGGDDGSGGTGDAESDESSSEAAEDALWLVDPVDAADLDDWLAERGTVAGVVLLLDRHKRDAARIAARHDVAVHVPEQFADVREELSAPTTILGDELGDTGFRPIPVVDRFFWHEVALFRDADRTLVVPEAVGTAAFFRVAGERLGVHPALRLFPPQDALGDLDPERVLVGHGEPVLADGAGALEDALAGSRRRAPRLYANALRSALPF